MYIRPAGTLIAIDNLELSRPDTGATLVEAFSLALKRGERLMISGPRGCGKSTILRTINSLWDHYTGEIRTFANAKVLSIPQKPYLPDLPLREILCYPTTTETTQSNGAIRTTHTYGEMRVALDKVGLSRLSLDDPHTGSWYASRLSLGEQQALVFARILLAKPDVLMLDEVTASLDQKSETNLYKMLLEEMPNVALISVSHHKQIIHFHTHLARIEDGKLTVTRVDAPRVK